MICSLCTTPAHPQPGWCGVPLCRQCRVDLEAQAQQPAPEEPRRVSLSPSYVERCHRLALAGVDVTLKPTAEVIDLTAVRAARLAGAAALLLLALVMFAASAAAQSPQQPYIYDVTVGTSSAQVIIANTTRKRIAFVNSSDTAKIAVCPTLSRRTGAALTCTVNGPGAITLLPYAAFVADNVQQGTLPAAWNAIATASGSALTIMEWE